MNKTIYLAGGCFWGMQKFFDRVDGVLETTVGYANGETENPTYEEVKSGKTGHAETVMITYDDEKVSLEELLKKFYMIIDPTSINKQGEDEGVSYRTGIFFTDDEGENTAKSVTEQIEKNIGKKTAVKVEKLENFYPAEEYHQKYLEKNPEGYCHIGGCFFE